MKSWRVLLFVAPALVAGGCLLNPQPDLPDPAEESVGVGGVNGSSGGSTGSGGRAVVDASVWDWCGRARLGRDGHRRTGHRRYGDDAADRHVRRCVGKWRRRRRVARGWERRGLGRSGRNHGWFRTGHRWRERSGGWSPVRGARAQVVGWRPAGWGRAVLAWAGWAAVATSGSAGVPRSVARGMAAKGRMFWRARPDGAEGAKVAGEVSAARRRVEPAGPAARVASAVARPGALERLAPQGGAPGRRRSSGDEAWASRGGGRRGSTSGGRCFPERRIEVGLSARSEERDPGAGGRLPARGRGERGCARSRGAGRVAGVLAVSVRR
jgi:hypothetical protein